MGQPVAERQSASEGDEGLFVGLAALLVALATDHMFIAFQNRFNAKHHAVGGSIFLAGAATVAVVAWLTGIDQLYVIALATLGGGTRALHRTVRPPRTWKRSDPREE